MPYSSSLNSSNPWLLISSYLRRCCWTVPIYLYGLRFSACLLPSVVRKRPAQRYERHLVCWRVRVRWEEGFQQLTLPRQSAHPVAHESAGSFSVDPNIEFRCRHHVLDSLQDEFHCGGSSRILCSVNSSVKQFSDAYEKVIPP